MVFGKKRAAHSINHPIVRQCKFDPIEPSRLIELTEELKRENWTVIDEVVDGHVRLAIRIASSYIPMAPTKTLDIVSEAFVALVEGCYNVQKMQEDGDLTGYLICRIHGRIFDFIRRDHMIRVPSSTMARKKQKRQEKALQEGYETKDPLFLKRVTLTPDCQSYLQPNLIEIKDMLEQSITCDLEKKVIDLRSQSYVDAEISTMLGISLNKVNEIRHEVEARYKKLEG